MDDGEEVAAVDGGGAGRTAGAAHGDALSLVILDSGEPLLVFSAGGSVSALAALRLLLVDVVAQEQFALFCENEVFDYWYTCVRNLPQQTSSNIYVPSPFPTQPHDHGAPLSTMHRNQTDRGPHSAPAYT